MNYYIVSPRYSDSICSLDVAIKINLLLYRILNGQSDMYEKSCFVLIPHRTYVLHIC